MTEPPVVTMDVQNIQLGACLVVDSFPADWLIIRVELRRRDDYDDAVRRLKDRYQIACALQPGFPPVRDAPRLRHLRYFPVTTARGVAEVREAHPASEDWWTSFEAALRPLQLILCLAQRRSINFVHHVARRRRSPDYALSPNLRAANYAGAFVKDTGRFVNQALVQYAGQVCSDNPPYPGLENALIYYLASFRDGIWLTERFFDAFLSLEILAEGFAGRTQQTRVACPSQFRQLQRELKVCVDNTCVIHSRSAREALKRGLGSLNRVPVTQKIRSLLAERGLRGEYGDSVREWVDVRNHLAHRGVTEAFSDDPDQRMEGFYWPFVQAIRGCLERIFLSILIGSGTPQRLYEFSDSPVRNESSGARWANAEVWPP